MSLVSLCRYGDGFPTHETAGRRMVCIITLLCHQCLTSAVVAETDKTLTIGTNDGEFRTMRLTGDTFHQANPP